MYLQFDKDNEYLSLCQNEPQRKTIEMKISSKYGFNFMEMKVIFITMVSHNAKKRHEGLGNDLLGTTNGKDSVPQEQCLLFVQILTDSSRGRVVCFKFFFSG